MMCRLRRSGSSPVVKSGVEEDHLWGLITCICDVFSYLKTSIDNLDRRQSNPENNPGNLNAGAAKRAPPHLATPL